MLLLAATLLFFPHYEITSASDSTVTLFSDASGNAYIVSASQGTQYLSKLDPDGNLIYRVTPNVGNIATGVAAVDAAGNVYAAITRFPRPAARRPVTSPRSIQPETSPIRFRCRWPIPEQWRQARTVPFI